MTVNLNDLKELLTQIQSVSARLSEIESDPNLNSEEKFAKMATTLRDLSKIQAFINEERLNGES